LEKELSVIQLVITPEVLGLFWLTNDDLIKKPKYFHSIDYLLDGLLTNYLNIEQQNEFSRQKKFFVSSSFGHPFFVSHIHLGSTDIQEELIEIMNIATPLKRIEHQKIVIIDNSTENISAFLDKKFKDFSFVNLS